MFGIIADLLSSIATTLFPIFASYKALRSGDLNHLAPWLMYWVVYSIIILAESWTLFIIGWLPFYSWVRLCLLLYLVLPQTQGAKKIYLEYVEPFLQHHENEIEVFIGRAHERGKAAGIQYLYKAIDLIREKVLGLPALWAGEAEDPTPAPSYAQSLFSRYLPAASSASSLAAPASDIVSLLGNVLGAVTSSTKTHDVQAEELSASGKLLPREFASAPRSQQAEYISSQIDRLKVLQTAFDRERRNLERRSESRGRREDDALAYGDYEMGGLRKNRSNNSFENIDHEDLAASTSIDQDRYVESRRSRTRGTYDGYY
ncbi:hypothetical protein FQN57_001609 [Myotisia sp. PD_48]|nr:hypothetical protein FQN57_001609 [Myotisia sp. PD_48]